MFWLIHENDGMIAYCFYTISLELYTNFLDEVPSLASPVFLMILTSVKYLFLAVKAKSVKILVHQYYMQSLIEAQIKWRTW